MESNIVEGKFCTIEGRVLFKSCKPEDCIGVVENCPEWKDMKLTDRYEVGTEKRECASCKHVGSASDDFCKRCVQWYDIVE